MAGGKAVGDGYSRRAAPASPTRTPADLDPAELRRRRLDLGLTQAQVAAALGVTPNTVARWERGEQRIAHPQEVDRVLTDLQARHGTRPAAPDEPLRLRPSRRPPPRQAATDAGPGRAVLAVELNSLIGRDRDVQRVADLVRAGQLVTLIGAGGVGKTRLALHVAHSLANATFPDGVVQVELADVADGRLLPQLLAAALRLRLQPDRPPLEVLVAAIGQRRLLLLLDSCEQLLAAAADLVSSVLAACPGVAMLATSRHPLGLPGEVVWQVLPLATPTLDDDQLEHVQTSAAAQLLIERIRAHGDAGFRLSPQTAPAVAEICRRLDGVPLALELAAARVPQIGVSQVAARLDRRFQLLTRGRGTAPARHQTLRATITFDYELLGDAERALLRWLSIFVGGFDLEAAEAIGASSSQTHDDAVLELLTQLISRALVVARPDGDSVRYRLPESVREFGLEQLAADPADDLASRNRHAAYVADLVRRKGPQPTMVGSDDPARLEVLDREQHNCRAALGWLLGRGAAADALELSLRLAPWWSGRGYVAEGRRWITDVLALPQPVATPARAHVLVWATILANFAGDWRAAWPLAEQALETARELDEPVAVIGALQQLAWLSLGGGDRAAAQGYFQQATATSQASGNTELEVTGRVFLSLLLLGSGQTSQAEHEAQTAFNLSREFGLTQELGRIQLALGLLALGRRDRTVARRRFEAAVQRLRSSGNRFWEAAALTALGRAAAELGDTPAAREALRAALEFGRSLGQWPVLRAWLEACAVLAGQQGAPRRALRLAGAATVFSGWTGGLPVVIPGLSEEWLAATRAAVGPAAEAAWADGCDLPTDDAIAEGLAEAAPPEAESGADVAAALTRRERQVVQLVALGRSNREIADELVIAAGTARVHVERILAKLHLRSRAQLVVWAVGHRLSGSPEA